MDPKTRDQISDWIAFFREIGIEDFYPRFEPMPGTRNGLLKSTALESHHPPADRGADVPSAGEAAASPKLPLAGLAVLERGGAAASAFQSSPPVSTTQSLSLFEAPEPRTPAKDETLEQIRADLGDCRRCKLWQGRKHIVFGQGNPRAELVFVGEGPGAEEDEQGLPFVGRAGQLLNRMLQLIQIQRESVYICNVVKCRPPGNRTPEPDEVMACSPFLFRQIAAIGPRLVCCLGAPAVRAVLGVKEGITKIHGRFYDYGNAKAIVTVHPAYVLRNPREEVILREDFAQIRSFLEQAHS
ncbi:MAG: uracil-DNA glycosylase [Terriglobia bacterium]